MQVTEFIMVELGFKPKFSESKASDLHTFPSALLTANSPISALILYSIQRDFTFIFLIWSSQYPLCSMQMLHGWRTGSLKNTSTPFTSSTKYWEYTTSYWEWLLLMLQFPSIFLVIYTLEQYFSSGRWLPITGPWNQFNNWLSAF